MITEQVYLDQLLKLVGDIWGVNCLKLNANGRCELITDNNCSLVIFLSAKCDFIHFVSELGFLPQKNTSKYLRRLLESNFHEKELRGAFFSLNKKNNVITFQYYYPFSNLTAELLSNLLSNFLNAINAAISIINTPLNDVITNNFNFCAPHVLKP